jgi:hypothetical protein
MSITIPISGAASAAFPHHQISVQSTDFHSFIVWPPYVLLPLAPLALLFILTCRASYETNIPVLNFSDDLIA